MRSPTVQLLLPDLLELIRQNALREVREALRQLDPTDVAEILAMVIEDHGAEEAAVAFRVLPRDDAGDVFSHLSAEEQEDLIEELGADRAVRAVEAMDPDDRARLLDELPLEVTRRILRSLRPEKRRQVQAILGYAPETVGRLMTPDYVRLRPHWTVDQALAHIRRFGRDAETVHWVYITEPSGKLIDDLHIRRLLLAEPTDTIESLLDGRYAALDANEDREEAVRTLNRYDRTALPVVDGRGLLVGIVTYDDVADVAEEEATEDIHKLGGLGALGQPYLETKTARMLRKRAPWLAGLFAFQLATIAVMGLFDEQLEAVVVLALFIPLIISSGGNTGTQAASMLVRALALEELEPRDWHGVLWRELRTGLILGTLLGLMGVATVVGCHFAGLAPAAEAGVWKLSLVVGTAVAGIVIWGSVAGSLLPLLLQKLGLDPAASSSPLVATLMDISGLTIYFGVASVILASVLGSA
ncbi:MAG: magnesium transporter [Planctomycetota bacterium]